jgi:hypothetical protein
MFPGKCFEDDSVQIKHWYRPSYSLELIANEYNDIKKLLIHYYNKI